MSKRFQPKTTLVWLLTLLVLSWSVASWAQETDEDEEEEASAEESESEETVDEDMETLTVTGSRLKRTTYNNISPLQIIDAEVEREAGLVDTAEILQKSTQASGIQIDLTFTGYVLDNGPAASTIALRGLEPDRSLVLVNGRRLAPAGVEGAPSSPDLNMIPGILVQQYELLLDGASSVYGSDAIAGVANIILRKDFDGIEIDLFADRDQYAGTTGKNIALTWGRNWDRGFIGTGATVEFNDVVTIGDAPHTSGCSSDAEITQDGEVRSKSLWFEYWYGMEWDECGYSGLHGNWVTRVPWAQLLFYTPGQSNGGWKDFSISRIRLGGQWFWTDEDNDDFNDVSWRPYIQDVNEQYRTLYPQFRRVNFMTYGEYTFEGDANITPFYELLYSKRSSVHNGGGYQLFPVVNANSPYNICNPNSSIGVDCGLAFSQVFENQSLRQAVFEVFGCDPGPGGTCDQSRAPLGPWPVQPVVVIEGDRNISHVDVAQYRYVGGVRFDVPFLNSRARGDWTGEASVSYSFSTGETHREGILDDRLQLGLGNYSFYGIPCVDDFGIVSDPKDFAGCVPVNLFAPSVLSPDQQGNFATQQERDYLFGVRAFDTEIYQTIFSVFLTGTVFDLQGGPVSTGFGYEERLDEIVSIPNDVASEGKFFGFSADQGAEGEKSITEWFGEVEMPLIGNLKFADELTVNLSARHSDDEFAGTAWTWSGKVAYRPFSSLLLRATKGTSFRGPNLRNLFLKAQTGFLNLFDPCVIPSQALDPITGEYIEENDLREEHILENCRRTGADPLVMDRFAQYSVEVASGGALDLVPETSTSETWGFSFEQPFTNAFNLALGGNVYKIVVDDTIIEPSAGFIISDCYYKITLDSPFCSRITRSTDAEDPIITYIHQGFINRDNETVRGIDFNVRYTDTFTILDRPILFSLDYIGHKLLERSSLFLIIGDEEPYDRVSQWGYHRYRHRLVYSAQFNDMRIALSTRVLGRQDQDDLAEDDWGSVPDFSGNTCLGPDEGDVLCRDIGSSMSFYFHHTLSFGLVRQSYSFSAGIRNITDVEPPFVDASEVFSLSNAPLGAGYDLLGRAVYASFSYQLGGGL
ncbi:MAG: TonB-dependent receptor [Gammaproteobacteria bacterium]|nr:TonB-dependent receptor [Gammaproteobacteria bacterium]